MMQGTAETAGSAAADGVDEFAIGSAGVPVRSAGVPGRSESKSWAQGNGHRPMFIKRTLEPRDFHSRYEY